MRHHTKILIWENNRRLNKLIKFRDLVIRYFNNQGSTDYMGFLDENARDKAAQIRTEINQNTAEIHNIITSSNISTKIIYTDPPLLGGRSRKFDLIFNMFDSRELTDPHEQVLDIIEMSIGVYKSNRAKSAWRMFNPFFWLGRIADGISEVVFNVIGEFGVGRQNAKKSALGRLFKGLVYLITNVVVPILILLQIMGFLEPLKQFVHKMF